MNRLRSATLAVVVFLAGAAAPVAGAAVPPCEGPVSQQTVGSDLGRVESIVAGGAGRLYMSLTPAESTVSRLVKVWRPGGPPRTLLDGPGGPGGLAWDRRRLLWGYGNLAETGETGDENPVSGLYSVNTSNGRRFVVSDRLGMANGVARGRNGAIYASNDFGMKLDRITPRGATVNGWATVDSANGLVISPDQRFLYAAQTFAEPSAIARIEIANPANVTTWASTEGVITGNPVFDGLAGDRSGNLYVAAWAAGEVWKVDSRRRFCILATGLGRPSTLAFGFGRKRFGASDLYVAGFNGELTRISGARRARFPG